MLGGKPSSRSGSVMSLGKTRIQTQMLYKASNPNDDAGGLAVNLKRKYCLAYRKPSKRILAKLQPRSKIVVGKPRILAEEDAGWKTLSGSFALCQLCRVANFECWLASLPPDQSCYVGWQIRAPEHP